MLIKNLVVYLSKKHMSLLNQNNKKGKKKDEKKSKPGSGQNSKFIQKPSAPSFVSKQQNTGSQRGS
jgi:hypothetical protein